MNYSPLFKSRIQSLIYIGFSGISFGCGLMFIYLFDFNSGLFGRFISFFVYCLGGIFFLLALILLMMFVSHNVSVLRISPSGIELSRWPLPSIKGSWDQVEKIVEGRLFGFRYATLLIRRPKPGFELRLGAGTLGSRQYIGIPLSDFKGWFDGEMRIQIEEFAHRLTEDA